MLQNALKLRFVQLAVDAALLKQLLMRALLDNDAVFHHESADRRRAPSLPPYAPSLHKPI